MACLCCDAIASCPLILGNGLEAPLVIALRLISFSGALSPCFNVQPPSLGAQSRDVDFSQKKRCVALATFHHTSTIFAKLAAQNSKTLQLSSNCLTALREPTQSSVSRACARRIPLQPCRPEWTPPSLTPLLSMPLARRRTVSCE